MAGPPGNLSQLSVKFSFDDERDILSATRVLMGVRGPGPFDDSNS